MNRTIVKLVTVLLALLVAIGLSRWAGAPPDGGHYATTPPPGAMTAVVKPRNPSNK